MKNYAGHRLSPWLGHLMLSRQESARALLTPGEVMQLPPNEEIVMAAGAPPIRAVKARYYTDARFTARILPSPTPTLLEPARRPKDDWTMLDPIAPPTPPASAPDPRSVATTGNAEAASAGLSESDSANAGVRREPGLGDHEDIVPAARIPEREFRFDFDRDDPGDDAARDRLQIDRSMVRNARTAALDPDDGIDL